MFMYKAGILISIELLVIAVGFYFFYLAAREKSKHLKIGAYILVIGGILLALGTSAMTIKKMKCKKHMWKMHHGGAGYEGGAKCLDHDHDSDDRDEKEGTSDRHD